jgi:RNA polymerase sigma-70 factor (ECF subfamily)
MTDWQAIVTEHGPRLWRTAYRLVGNEADAADAVQETFLSALDYSRGRTVRDWNALLVRLATHRSLDLLRRRRRSEGRAIGLDDWSGVAGDEADPSHPSINGELTDRLRTALAHLPVRQAEVFCLRAVQELSYRQIAAELDVSLPAVAVMLHRARRTLRRLLKNDVELHRRGLTP